MSIAGPKVFIFLYLDLSICLHVRLSVHEFYTKPFFIGDSTFSFILCVAWYIEVKSRKTIVQSKVFIRIGRLISTVIKSCQQIMFNFELTNDKTITHLFVKEKNPERQSYLYECVRELFQDQLTDQAWLITGLFPLSRIKLIYR